MINAIKWFKEKGFTFDDKITIKDVIDLQSDAVATAAAEISDLRKEVTFILGEVHFANSAESHEQLEGAIKEIVRRFPHAKSMVEPSNPESMICPFCGEHDFDQIGLKGHLMYEDCEQYKQTKWRARVLAV